MSNVSTSEFQKSIQYGRKIRTYKTFTWISITDCILQKNPYVCRILLLFFKKMRIKLQKSVHVGTLATPACVDTAVHGWMTLIGLIWRSVHYHVIYILLTLVASTTPLRECGAAPAENRHHRIYLSGSEWLDHAEGPPKCFVIASGGGWKDIGMTALASAWAMDRRRPKDYRRKVDAATRCFGVCPHTWPDMFTQCSSIFTLRRHAYTMRSTNASYLYRSVGKHIVYFISIFCK